MTEFPPEEFSALADELRTTARGLLPAIIDKKLALMITALDIAAAPVKWQDIETAPLDGTYVLALREHLRPSPVAVVSWRAWALGDDVLGDTQMRWRTADGRHFSPTKWMSIPELDDGE